MRTQYSAPYQHYTVPPQPQHNTPTLQYTAPMLQYNAPAQQYAASTQQYTKPAQHYTVAQPQHNAERAPPATFAPPPYQVQAFASQPFLQHQQYPQQQSTTPIPAPSCLSDTPRSPCRQLAPSPRSSPPQAQSQERDEMNTSSKQTTKAGRERPHSPDHGASTNQEHESSIDIAEEVVEDRVFGQCNKIHIRNHLLEFIRDREHDN
jgi:hypothetical protein